jgi:hypothetical protein
MKAFEICGVLVEEAEDGTVRLSGDGVLSPADVDRLRRDLKPLGAEAIRKAKVTEAVRDYRARVRESAPRRATPLRSRPQPAVPDATRRLIAKRSGGHCELRLEGCWGQATDPAHRKGKKAGGRFGQAKIAQSKASAVLYACRHCHDLTTDAVQPHLSGYRLLGFLLTENQDPLQVPVILKHVGTVWLDDDGNYCDEPPAGVA